MKQEGSTRGLFHALYGDMKFDFVRTPKGRISAGFVGSNLTFLLICLAICIAAVIVTLWK